MNQFISRIAALTLAVAMAAAPTTAYAANYNDMDSVTNTGVSTKVSPKLPYLPRFVTCWPLTYKLSLGLEVPVI